MFDKMKKYAAYDQAINETVSDAKQIVRVYDVAIMRMLNGKQAADEGRITDRFNYFIGAVEVFAGLRDCLDYENGGEIANILSSFYSNMNIRILAFSRGNRLEDFDAALADVRKMRESWVNVDCKIEEKSSVIQDKIEINSNDESQDEIAHEYDGNFHGITSLSV